ncbi:hypothetical protein GF342_05935 [Candidatus Woesearchaeota archaeon]|nr:hypothetical protein [Candidatus Woesearchaeota archaeon]
MAKCGNTRIEYQEGSAIMIIDCDECDFFPSIENQPKAMELVLQKIIDLGHPHSIRLEQLTEYEYNPEQTKILSQMADVIVTLQEEVKKLDVANHKECKSFFGPRMAMLVDLFTHEILLDPIGAYVQFVRTTNEDKKKLKAGVPEMPRADCLDKYARFVEYAKKQLSQTSLITKIDPDIARFQIGDRSGYTTVFQATIKPDFMRSKIQAQYPLNAQILDSYHVVDPVFKMTVAEVTIFELVDSEQRMYHVVPIEANLTWEKYNILHAAKERYETRPTAEIQDHTGAYLENPRGSLFNVSLGIINDVVRSSATPMDLSKEEFEELAAIFVRNTIGFGVIEILLTDKKVQDIVVNTPNAQTPIYIKMRGFGECITNITPTVAEVKSWGTRLKFLSGRPLDRSHPILDTDKLEVPGNFRSRTAIITSPLVPEPDQYALAIRQHAPDPVTFARYSQPLVTYKEMSAKVKRWGATTWGSMMLAPSKRLDIPLAAGLLSFLIDGKRTFLVAGTRSSGKTTLLSSLLVNISRKVRIITIEDTLEIPVGKLKEIGFNIQSLKVASALARGSREVSAEEGIRSTLRLGDSSLIVGEVRSTEARSLYEAMRVGALANVVAGTIHANDPYGVFDRVVNDLEVPTTSFKATDIVLMARPLPDKTGPRMTSITEVRKFWTTDPLTENGFVELVDFDHDADALEPTEALLRGDSQIIKEIGARYAAFAGQWDRIWENIILRSQVIKEIIAKAIERENPDIVRAPFYVDALDAFRDISWEVHDEIKAQKGVGYFDPSRILRLFKHWLDRAAKELVR